MMPTGASSTTWKQFDYKGSVYNTHREYILQTKEPITKYFPENFTGLYDAEGNLPIELINHLDVKNANHAADARDWKRIIKKYKRRLGMTVHNDDYTKVRYDATTYEMNFTCRVRNIYVKSSPVDNLAREAIIK